VASARFHWAVTDRAVSGGCKAWRGRYNYDVWAQDSFSLLQMVERLGGSVVCEGFAARAAHAGPVVYVANHMSMLETMLLPCVLTPFSPVVIVLKDSLLRYPFFGALCRAIRPIVVSRTNVRADLQAVLEQGKEKLASGASVLLFPQGTRMEVFEPRRFNSMGTKLAQAAGVPLVPIALRTDFVGIGRWIKDLGGVIPAHTVRFAAGPCLAPEQPARLLHQHCLTFIAGRFREWGVPFQEPAAGADTTPG
jgi:1-acyl-sn-glycerol-3-phosphate acyltransferase